MSKERGVLVDIPAHYTDQDAAEALTALAEQLAGGEPVSKALKNPLPSIDRASARAGFLRLQKRFGRQLKPIFEGVADANRLVQEMENDGDRRRAKAMLDRQHQRATTQVNALLDAAYEAAFGYGLRGAGAGREILDNELTVLRNLRINENAYSAQFLTDVAHGEGTMDYDQRANLYVSALEEVYWQGYTYADQSSGRYIKWVMPYGRGLKEAEHCADCAILSGNPEALADNGIEEPVFKGAHIGGRWGDGTYSAQELAKMGVYPQSGQLVCTTHCHCYLAPTTKPAGKPQYRALTKFRSVDPKSFTGTVRDEDGKIHVTRQANPRRTLRLARQAAKTEHKHVNRRGGGK